MRDLFEPTHVERLGPGAVLLTGRALASEQAILAALSDIVAKARFRHMTTPGGFVMSVAMTNCGTVGWVTDRTGYRYQPLDPLSRSCWPPIPEVLLRLAAEAAQEGGFDRFTPDACLINRYAPGTRLSLHQDKDEQDFSQPIVSISLGLPATFLFAGSRRADKPKRIAVHHGDVVIWGGPSRLAYHGVAALKDGCHPVLGRQRLNLSLRKAL